MTRSDYNPGDRVMAPIFPGTAQLHECIIIERSDSLVDGWLLVKPCQLDDYGLVKVSANDARAVKA